MKKTGYFKFKLLFSYNEVDDRIPHQLERSTKVGTGEHEQVWQVYDV